MTKHNLKRNNPLELAFILHTRPYRETSIIVELFVRNFGRVTGIAKGVRQVKSALRGNLQPFTLLWVKLSGKNELKSLYQAEVVQTFHLNTQEQRVSGFYINELLIKLLPKSDPDLNLFDSYHQALSALSSTEKSYVSLRLFEMQLLESLGYAFIFEKHENQEPIRADHEYHYFFEKGFVPCHEKINTEKAHRFPGKNLLAISKKEFHHDEVLNDAKLLFRHVIQHLLGERKLLSRELFPQ